MSADLTKQPNLAIDRGLPPEISAYINLIENAASNPDVDVVKLEKLLEMQERIMQRRAEMSFNAAMTSAQQGMKPIEADASNPQTRSRYATYKALDKVLRPIYITNGFALSFNTSGDAPPDCVRVLCDVSHKDGFTKHYQVDMPNDGKGAKGGDVMTKTHATGAGMSYGMRYLLKMIFNVAIGEEDNDGNQPVEKITEGQAADLKAKIEEVKADEKKFLKYLATSWRCIINSVKDIPAERYSDAIKVLEKKAA